MNRYNQVPHLTQDTNGNVTNSQLDTTNESQEGSHFPAGDHKAHINKRAQRHSKHKTKKTQKIHKRSTALERSVKYITGGLNLVKVIFSKLKFSVKCCMLFMSADYNKWTLYYFYDGSKHNESRTDCNSYHVHNFLFRVAYYGIRGIVWLFTANYLLVRQRKKQLMLIF